MSRKGRLPLMPGAAPPNLLTKSSVSALGVSAELRDVLRERPRNGLKQLQQQDGLSLFSFTRRFGRKRPRRVSGEFLVARPTDGPVSYIVCVCASQFFRHGLAHLLESLYLHASRAFLTQRELGDALVNRHVVRPHKNPPRRIKANIEVPVLPVGRQTLHLFSDRVLVIDPGGSCSLRRPVA